MATSLSDKEWIFIQCLCRTHNSTWKAKVWHQPKSACDLLGSKLLQFWVCLTWQCIEGDKSMKCLMIRLELWLIMSFGKLYSKWIPALGQTLVWGRLRSMGLSVTRARLREAMWVSDPIHTALRWSEITPRRPYSVPGPNSLWHVDGHHKLIRWRMVTHCAIDGYSRLVVFLNALTTIELTLCTGGWLWGVSAFLTIRSKI